MFNEEVTTADGRTKRVIASDKKEFEAAKKAAQAETLAPTFDINVPVKKGHDLLTINDDLTVEAVDGTGAHNSPRDAVRDDGTVEGDPEVPVVVGESVDRENRVLKSDGEVVDNTDVKEA